MKVLGETTSMHAEQGTIPSLRGQCPQLSWLRGNQANVHHSTAAGEAMVVVVGGTSLDDSGADSEDPELSVFPNLYRGLRPRWPHWEAECRGALTPAGAGG